MNVSQLCRSAIAGLLLLGGGLGVSQAQEGTPAPDQPGQYIFYPSEPAQPGGDLPGDPQLQLVKVTDDLFEPVNVAARTMAAAVSS